MWKYLTIIHQTLMFIGYALIGSGILFFLENAQIIDLNWHLVWPLILIALGAYIIYAIHRLHTGFDHVVKKIFKKLS